MPITEETRNKIIQDFIFCFQSKYGEDWIRYLDKNLSPSPNKELAQKHRVSLNVIRNIRAEIRLFGVIVSACFAMESDNMADFENLDGQVDENQLLNLTNI